MRGVTAGVWCITWRTAAVNRLWLGWVWSSLLCDVFSPDVFYCSKHKNLAQEFMPCQVSLSHF